jgi:hypothetical protein
MIHQDDPLAHFLVNVSAMKLASTSGVPPGAAPRMNVTVRFG